MSPMQVPLVCVIGENCAPGRDMDLRWFSLREAFCTEREGWLGQCQRQRPLWDTGVESESASVQETFRRSLIDGTVQALSAGSHRDGIGGETCGGPCQQP